MVCQTQCGNECTRQSPSSCGMCPGTVVVRPEPVDQGRDDFRGPEFRSRRSGTLKRDLPRRRGGETATYSFILIVFNQTS